MNRINFASALLLLLSASTPIWSFAFSRHSMSPRAPRRSFSQRPPQHDQVSNVRMGHSRLQMGLDVMEIIPVSIYAAAVISVVAMQSEASKEKDSTSDKEKKLVEKMDEATADQIQEVIEAEEEAIMEAQIDVLLDEIEETEEEAQTNIEPKQAPVVATKDKGSIPEAAPISKPKATAPPPPPPPAPKASKPPPSTKQAIPPSKPKPSTSAADKPAVTVSSSTAATTSTTVKESVVSTPAAIDTVSTRPPKYQVLRKHEDATTPRSLSDLKKDVASTLEGEREKGERLKIAALKRQEEDKKAATKLDEPAQSAAATSTTAATAVAATDGASEAVVNGDDGAVQPKRGLRRKAWRLVKKVVAPWRKWENIN